MIPEHMFRPREERGTIRTETGQPKGISEEGWHDVTDNWRLDDMRKSKEWWTENGVQEEEGKEIPFYAFPTKDAMTKIPVDEIFLAGHAGGVGNAALASIPCHMTWPQNLQLGLCQNV